MNVSENYRQICWKKWPNLQVSRIFDVFLSHGGSSRVSDHDVIHWWSRVTSCDRINILDSRTTVLLTTAQGKLAENRLVETNIQLARQTSSVYEEVIIIHPVRHSLTIWLDGRNPAPPGMFKTNNGDKLSTGAGFVPSRTVDGCCLGDPLSHLKGLKEGVPKRPPGVTYFISVHLARWWDFCAEWSARWQNGAQVRVVLWGCVFVGRKSHVEPIL